MSRMPDPGQLDRMFFALSDANRRHMLERLSAGPTSVTELGQPLGIAMSSVVKHLAVLESGGLVESDKAGRVRTYRVAPGAFAAMEKWVAAHKTRLNAQFDRLDAYLAGKKTRKS
ncbi:MAG: ArsR/SmtB family transcription factor [Ramlibacter sp.]